MSFDDLLAQVESQAREAAQRDIELVEASARLRFMAPESTLFGYMQVRAQFSDQDRARYIQGKVYEARKTLMDGLLRMAFTPQSIHLEQA